MTLTRVQAANCLAAARAIQSAADSVGMSPAPLGEKDTFNELVTDDGLRNCVRALYVNGHHAQSVEEAYKYVNNLVKDRTGLAADGAGLMKTAFSLNNPVIKINELRTASQRDQQLGYMDIFAGCMTGIRNPRAHEHQYMDTPQVALEMLVWANHLVRIVRYARI